MFLVKLNHYTLTVWSVWAFLCILENSVNGRVAKKSCDLSLPSDIPKNEPLYLTQHQKRIIFFKPTSQKTHVTEAKPLTLYCPGGKNELIVGNKTISGLLHTTCKGNNRFDSSNIGEFYLRNANCTKKIHAEVLPLNTSCGQHSALYTVGFRIDHYNLISLYDVCFDESMISSQWTRHTINGNAIKFNIKENDRRDFKSTSLPPNANIANVYKKSSQLQYFTSTFGQTQNYLNSSSFLAKGHLTPDADFIFPNAQFATYFYLNVCPQFQIVNGGNWKRIESLSRRLASQYNADLTIYTGVYDQLKLMDGKSESASLHLGENNKIPVPKWIWKVLLNENTDSGIVFITLNNPFARIENINEFCTNVCTATNFNSEHFQNVRKGYTFCCEINDFKKVVKTLPASVTAKRLINGGSITMDF